MLVDVKSSGMVVVRFTTRGHIGSHIAAWLASAGDFNHCMLIDGGMAYEAVTWHGVRYVPERIAMLGIVRYQDMYVPVPDIALMRHFLRQQLGADYDWPGAFGFPVKRAEEWQDPDRWWCRELTVAALAAGGAVIDLQQCDFPKSPIITIRN